MTTKLLSFLKLITTMKTNSQYLRSESSLFISRQCIFPCVMRPIRALIGNLILKNIDNRVVVQRFGYIIEYYTFNPYSEMH